MNITGKRANFVSIQLSQYVPFKNNETSRLRTGYEKVVAQRTSLPFAYVAEDDGKIIDINDKIKMFKVQYKDGTIAAVRYGEEYSCNSGQGFYVTQNIVLKDIKLNKQVKKGDVLCYNDGCFKDDPYSSQVNWSLGKLAYVALADSSGTIEDSTIISSKLSKSINIAPVHVKQIVLTKDTTVHQIADIGTEVSSTDPIITFDETSLPEDAIDETKLDQETIDLLNKMNRATPKAEYNGTVVNVECFYKCSEEDMSKSLQTIIKKFNSVKNRKSKYAKKSNTEDEYDEVKPIIHSDRLSNITLDDDVIVLKFYIKQGLDAHPGDKIVVGSSLKSVISRVESEPIFTEDEEHEIDAIFSLTGISDRIITSPLLQGFTNTVLERLEKEIINIWES